MKAYVAMSMYNAIYYIDVITSIICVLFIDIVYLIVNTNYRPYVT